MVVLPAVCVIIGVAAGVARDTRTVMLDKGRKLHERIHKESKILHDHRYWLKTHSKSFTGIDFIKWLIEIGEASNGDEGVRLGQALLESGVIHHVGDKHQFKNSQLAYVFRYDDGTFQTSVDAKSELAKGLRVYSCLNSLYKSPLHDHKSGLRSIRLSISGTRLVDWLLKERLVETRKEGVAFGVHLMATGLLKHSTDNQKFNDTGAYYQFVPDAVFNQPLQQMDFVPISTFLCQTIMVCCGLCLYV
jgi:phosphatidylinositol-3,4,5-trisphosphate-dependent Rac exchanger protein 1